MDRQGDFLPTNMANRLFARFTHQDGPSSLHLMTFLGPQGGIVAHINLHDEPRQARQRHRTQPDIWDILPPIEPAPGAKQVARGGSDGSDRVEANAYVETNLDLVARAVHYIDLLKRSGWELRDEALFGPLAWSTWTFPDDENEPWRALFFILNRPDVAQCYTLRLEAEWADTSSTGSGGSGGVTFGHLGPG